MPLEDYHPMRTAMIIQEVLDGGATERLAFFRSRNDLARLQEFEELLGLLATDGRPIIDVSAQEPDATSPTPLEIDPAFEGVVYIHFGERPFAVSENDFVPTGAYVGAGTTESGTIEGLVIFVSAAKPLTLDRRPLSEVLADHAVFRSGAYEYDAAGHYSFRIDGDSGAFMSNEQTECLMPLIYSGISMANELADDLANGVGVVWPQVAVATSAPIRDAPVIARGISAPGR